MCVVKQAALYSWLAVFFNVTLCMACRHMRVHARHTFGTRACTCAHVLPVHVKRTHVSVCVCTPAHTRHTGSAIHTHTLTHTHTHTHAHTLTHTHSRTHSHTHTHMHTHAHTLTHTHTHSHALYICTAL